MTGMNHLVLGNMQRLLVLKDCYLLSKAGLLSTSTPSLSWICEALVPVLKVVTDVLVFVVNKRLLEYKTVVSGLKQGIWKSRTARMSTSCRDLIKGKTPVWRKLMWMIIIFVGIFYSGLILN